MANRAGADAPNQRMTPPDVLQLDSSDNASLFVNPPNDERFPVHGILR
jgi:hypothetical protein